MKLTAFCLIFLFLGVAARTWSQTVTYKARSISLEKLFVIIKQQTGYAFFYNDEDLKKTKPVTVEFSNTPLHIVLQQSMKDQPVDYAIQGKTIVISARTEHTPTALANVTEEAFAAIDVHGKVTDESGKPAVGVSVKVKGTNKGTVTNDNGEFTLSGIDAGAVLVFSSVNMETYETKLNGRNDIALTMKTKVSQLEDVAVQVNTGYQTIPKERATGSFVIIDSSLINRSISTNILDRLENITSGLVFNKNLTLLPNGKYQNNQSILAIRGRSTINSNPNPLIVVDNFPYDGDLSTINPDDVESITVLKDAAAASIWGAYSGNGVIVITTKKGKYNQLLKVTLNSNLTLGDKPNLYYSGRISSSDYIDLETFLFSKGFYNSSFSNAYAPVSPIVQILAQRRAGLISSADSASQIDSYRNLDTRKDITNLFYQRSVQEHNDINLSGGNSNNKYYFATGFDKNTPILAYNSYQRIVVKAANTFSLLNQKLELSTDLQYSESTTNNNNILPPNSFPYLKLIDGNGNALSTVNTNANIRQSYIDTAGQGKLLDWNYRPYDEIRNANNVTKLTDYHFNINAKYKVIKGLSLSIYYNYNKGISDQQNYQSLQTFSTRNLVNYYSQVNFSTGTVTRPIPLGGILDRNNVMYESNNIRGIVEFSHSWKGIHFLNFIAGSELRKLTGFSYTSRLYGYNPDNTTFGNVDYANQYRTYLNGSSILIPSNITNLGSINNYISYYGLVGYNYKSKYGATISARRDEANIYGVNSNMKGIPLFSGGFSWDISKEPFYNIKQVPYLKLRITDGYQGNNNVSVAALTTIQYSSVNNNYGAAQAPISNLPNPNLQWEKINQLNFGVDFNSKNEKITGSFDYFIKYSSNLIIPIPLDPTSGASTITTNAGNMRTNGFDITISSQNIVTDKFQWRSRFLLSYARDEITKYIVKLSTISNFTNSNFLTPLEGKPLYGVYAYRWAGLDSLGNPQAILDGNVSKNYSAFPSSANYDNLHYMGPSNPTLTGSLLNTFRFKQFEISFLISYKFGYYFRRPSVNYASLFITSGGNLLGTNDYALRWQKPGDEKITNVPALIYPNSNSNRDNLYANSDILIEKGDHIRLQDVQFSYILSKQQIKKVFFQTCQFYVYANNLGILWRANKYNIDPDIIPANIYTYPNPTSFSFGVKLGF